MPAYLINKFNIVDELRFDEYVVKVMPLIAKHGGTVLVGNKAARGLEGPAPGMNVVIEFPTDSDAMAFYEDPDYQPVKDIRLSATTNTAAVMSSLSRHG
jgi:uncharacterized protein (DUF1330 family)